MTDALPMQDMVQVTEHSVGAVFRPQHRSCRCYGIAKSVTFSALSEGLHRGSCHDVAIGHGEVIPVRMLTSTSCRGSSSPAAEPVKSRPWSWSHGVAPLGVAADTVEAAVD